MIINSNFSSLYLGRKEDWHLSFDKTVRYVQKFALGEEIRIQFTGFTDGFSAVLTPEKGAETQIEVFTLYTDPGYSGRRLYELAYSVETEGFYRLRITNGAEDAYAYFCVTALENLRHTVLFNYAHRRNEFDTLFLRDDGTKKEFRFRVEGGFYPADKTQAVQNEMFRDQRFSPCQLSADTYEISVLTIGSKRGVPQWVGNKVNSIFRTSDVLVNDIETVRNEGSVPELIQISEFYPLYVFKLSVEQPCEERIYTQSGAMIFDEKFDIRFN